MALVSAGEVLPVLLLPGGQDHPDCGHHGQGVVDSLLQGVALQVQVLQGGQILQRLNLHISDKIFAGDELDERGNVSEDGGELDEGVGGDVDGLQGGAGGELARQVGDPVVGHIQLCDITELHGELGRDLADHILGEVAGDDVGVGHQEEDSVRDLLQLAVRQV